MSNTTTDLPPSPQEVLPPVQPLASLLSDMVLDYARRDGGQPMHDWLADTLVQRGGVDRAAAQQTAQSLLSYMQDSHRLHGDLTQHLEKGKSRSSWIARQIEKIASDHRAAPADVAALSELLAGKAPAGDQPAKSLDWNDMSRIALSKGIEQQNLLQAATSAVDDGARDWAGNLAAGWLKDQPDSAKLVQQFVRGELDLDRRAGLQATLAAGTEIATRRGLLGADMKQAIDQGKLIPAWFGQNTFISTENASVLYDLGTGKLDPTRALDRMADVATAAVTNTTREVCKQVGGKIGAALAMKIPVIGPFLTPVGRWVGSAVGIVVGELADTAVRTVIKKGVEAVKTVAKSVWEGAKSVATTVARALNPFNWF